MDEYYEQVLYEDHKVRLSYKFVQVVLLIAATCLC